MFRALSSNKKPVDYALMFAPSENATQAADAPETGYGKDYGIKSKSISIYACL
jgi:hypothetical protein